MTAWRKTLLGMVIPLLAGSGCSPHLVWRGKSPDHRRTVEVHARGGAQWVDVDGVPNGPFPGVAENAIVFSPDGAHLAYPVCRDSTWAVMRDGVPGPAWDGVGQIVFSPDGARLAYAAERDGAWCFVVDGVAGAAADSLLSGSATFSPDGRRFAYAGWFDGGLRVVADGIAGEAWAAVGNPVFGDDGTLFHVGVDNRGMTLVGDHRVLDRHEHIGWLTPGPGGRLAYAACDGGPWYVVVDGRSEPPYPRVHGLAFEPGGGRFAYVAGDDREEIMVVDGVAGRSWDEVGDPVFNRNGGRLGYIARTDTLTVVLVEGVAVGVHENADSLVFSPRGDRYAYLAADGEAMTVVDDLGSHGFPLLVGGSLVFSEDGIHWGCLAGDPGDRRLCLAVDGRTTDVRFDWLLFSSTVSSRMEELATGRTGVELLGEWVSAELELWREAHGADSHEPSTARP